MDWKEFSKKWLQFVSFALLLSFSNIISAGSPDNTLLKNKLKNLASENVKFVYNNSSFGVQK